jgi:hypothetical protein
MGGLGANAASRGRVRAQLRDPCRKRRSVRVLAQINGRAGVTSASTLAPSAAPRGPESVTRGCPRSFVIEPLRSSPTHPKAASMNVPRVVRDAVAGLSNLLVLKSIPQGAATQRYVATNPALAAVSGQYFADCNIAKPRADAEDLSLARTEAGSASSHATGVVGPFTEAQAARAFSNVRAAATTWALRNVSTRKVSNPRPELQPVRRYVLPLSETPAVASSAVEP